MKKIFITFLIVFTGFFTFSQNEVDAFRFSEMFYGGTARSMAMGNAFGALGADLSTASTNPAGIGVFKHANITFAPSIVMSNINADFNGTSTQNDKLSMVVNNFGATFGFRDKNSNIKALNFAFGYNRYNNYSQNYNISGTNNKGSMLDAFMYDANGKVPGDLNAFSTYGAWYTYLIDTVPGTLDLDYTNPLWWYLSDEENPEYGQSVTKTGQIKGGGGETFFTGAININDFFYFGTTIGLQSLYYRSMTVYTENNFNDNDTIIDSFSFTEYLTDEGTGVNFKAGFIIRPFDFIRIGGAFHSPTYYTIEDKYSTSIVSYWKKPDSEGNYDSRYSTEENFYKYNLLTPMRLMANVGFVIGNFALIGVDYEYVDYGAMRLSADDYMFTDENENIREDFKPTYNLKGGAELRLGVVSLRGGYAYFGNPYNNGNIYEKTQITGGIGFASNNVFMDFAYIHDVQKYSQHLYNGYTDEPVPEMTNTRGIINATFGLRF